MITDSVFQINSSITNKITYATVQYMMKEINPHVIGRSHHYDRSNLSG